MIFVEIVCLKDGPVAGAAADVPVQDVVHLQLGRVRVLLNIKRRIDKSVRVDSQIKI